LEDVGPCLGGEVGGGKVWLIVEGGLDGGSFDIVGIVVIVGGAVVGVGVALEVGIDSTARGGGKEGEGGGEGAGFAEEWERLFVAAVVVVCCIDCHVGKSHHRRATYDMIIFRGNSIIVRRRELLHADSQFLLLLLFASITDDR